MSTPGIRAEDAGLSPENLHSADMTQWAHLAHEVSGREDVNSVTNPSVSDHSEKKSFLATLSEKALKGIHRVHDAFGLQGQIMSDDRNLELYPELNWDAELRRSNALHPDEALYLDRRRKRIAESGALAKFLGLPEGEDVHPDDAPIIGLGGSGGGFRANLGFITVFRTAKELGLWDLISYLAGVSGSCWAVGAYMTFGNRDPQALLDHFAANAFRHPLSPHAIDAVADSPDGAYYQFAPLLMKVKTGVNLAILDLYSTFTTSYMWLPLKGRLESGEDKPQLRKEWFQWSKVWQRSGVEAGEEPFPIVTAVRHERPWRDWKSSTEPFDSNNNANEEHQTAPNAWWQWFEFSPLEMGCDELEGWIPTWAFGRKFDQGRSLQRMPEQSLSLILGLATSAPAGPLSSYLATIYASLPHDVVGSTIKGISHIVERAAPTATERFGDHNPVHACNEANPFFGAKKEENRGQGIENSPRVHLIDAGLGNNMPTYSFVRPNRDVDVVINCDYSSDVQKGAALQRVNDFGKQKGLAFVPRVKLPPLRAGPRDKDGKPRPETAKEIEERFKGRYCQVIDGTPLYADRQTPPPPGFHYHNEPDQEQDPILYNEHHQPQARRGVLMVYVPLLPNKVQPDYDPATAPWSSSYNLVWTADQVHTIARTQRQNILDIIETIRGVVREAYERRKQERLSGLKPFAPVLDTGVHLR